MGTSLAEIQWFPGRERRKERRQASAELYPELSLNLENPLARILVLPTSAEFQKGAGADGSGESFAIRVAPRVPFVLNEDWHLISKTDVAWVWQDDVAGPGQQDGLSDLVQTFFLSPERSLDWDVHWGIGPSFIIPTATHDSLGTRKFSIGPSLSIFRQRDEWTTSLTLNHSWSVAGSDSAPHVSLTTIRPVLAYIAPSSTTIALGADLSYDWNNEVWRGPVSLRLSQLTILGKRPIQWGIGFEYFPMDDDPNEADWGALFQISVPFEAPDWGRR